MPSLDELAQRVAAQDGLEESLELLLGELAARIKATSNDQNIQRLARDLARVAPDLVRAVASKESVG